MVMIINEPHVQATSQVRKILPPRQHVTTRPISCYLAARHTLQVVWTMATGTYHAISDRFNFCCIFFASNNSPKEPIFYFFNTPFCDHPRGPSATRGPAARCSHTHRHYARGEARGGDSAESARTSLSKGGSPPTLAVLEIGRESKLAAKDLAAATGNNPDHRPTTAAMVAARYRGRAVRARARANNRTKLAASALQRPPTSMPRTIKRHRDARPNSG